MIIKYTNVLRIFNEVNKFKPDFVEIDIIDWIGQALGLMSVPKLYQEAVCYAEVSNFQTLVPKYTHAIIQIVKDNDYYKIKQQSICETEDVVENNEEKVEPIQPCYFFPQGEGYPVLVNQLGQPITDFEYAFYRPFLTDNSAYFSLSNLRSNFEPVRLSTNNFFNTIVCEDKNIPYENCTEEYKIIEGELLRFSFEEGGVIISFLRQQVDENGYPKIPEHDSVILAILHYIRYQYALSDFYEYRQGSESRLQKSEIDWHWYCKQAKNSLRLPNTIDEWQNLLEQRNYLVPRDNYYGYFGHLGRKEKRSYLKP